MFVCNCNGIRESVVQGIARECNRPADIFKAVGCKPKCGQCLDDMRRHINAASRTEPKPARSATSKRRQTP